MKAACQRPARSRSLRVPVCWQGGNRVGSGRPIAIAHPRYVGQSRTGGKSGDLEISSSSLGHFNHTLLPTRRNSHLTTRQVVAAEHYRFH